LQEQNRGTSLESSSRRCWDCGSLPGRPLWRALPWNVADPSGRNKQALFHGSDKQPLICVVSSGWSSPKLDSSNPRDGLAPSRLHDPAPVWSHSPAARSRASYACLWL